MGSLDTDSSLGVLSPVPGTGFWEPDLAQVALLKGEEGLGFSILDFAVSGFHIVLSKFISPFNFPLLPRTPTRRASGLF